MKVKILSSKLVLSTKHAQTILSALNNPINVELVQQLDKYVDWDKIVYKKSATDENEKSAEQVTPVEKDEKTSSNEDNQVDVDDNRDEDVDKNDEDENLETSIKNSLNILDKCKGVDSVSIKGSEVWVQYQPDVNIHEVMFDAIKQVGVCATTLTFTKLDRQENAIVFNR